MKGASARNATAGVGSMRGARARPRNELSASAARTGAKIAARRRRQKRSERKRPKRRNSLITGASSFHRLPGSWDENDPKRLYCFSSDAPGYGARHLSSE